MLLRMLRRSQKSTYSKQSRTLKPLKLSLVHKITIWKDSCREVEILEIASKLIIIVNRLED